MNKLILSVLLIIFLLSTHQVWALSTTLEISDDQAVEGDILVYKDSKLTRSTETYSKDLFGVIDSSVLLIEQTGIGKPVTTSGIAQVNVTSTGGPIKKGDLITSSTTPGKGQKATLSGYILGKAMEDLTTDTGRIIVEIRIENNQVPSNQGGSQIFGTLNSLLQKNLESQDSSFKFMQYILAAVVCIVSIGVAFFAFSRSIPKSIEAIGRNPLAKRSIQTSIVINAILTIFVAVAGVIAAIVILRL